MVIIKKLRFVERQSVSQQFHWNKQALRFINSFHAEVVINIVFF